MIGQEHLEDPMADAMLRKNLKSDVSITCQFVKGEIAFNIRKLKPKNAEDQVFDFIETRFINA